MAKKIKIGDYYVEVPEDSYLVDSDSDRSDSHVSSEKPDSAEEFIEEKKIYNLNDPYVVDRWEAIGNFHKVEKTWLRKGYFVFFIIIPFLIFQAGGLAIFFSASSVINGIKGILVMNFLWLILLMPALKVWNEAKSKN